MKQKILQWKRLSLLMVLFPFLALPVMAQDFEVKGKVTAVDDGAPLVGVAVVVEGTTIGTATNSNGEYRLAVPDANSTLVFSFIGYVPQQIRVGNRTTIDVRLAADILDVEEVVVVGYRTQARGSVTGSVSSVQSAELQDMPVENLSNALAGRLSGVRIAQSAGTPGMESNLTIRTQGTFNNTQPLYVIDGIVSDKFAFDGLSPTEVSSVTILKDGASSAIYGSRAANGVILVTTKRGNEGAPRLSYSGIYGMQKPTLIPETLTAWEHANAINEALRYNSVPETDARYYTADELDYFSKNSWDWVEELWETPMTTQHTLDVSGGTSVVRYFLGGSYNYATGSFNNLNYNKLTLRANVDVSVTKDLKVSLDLNSDKRGTNGPSWDTGNWRQEDMYKALQLRTKMVPPYIDGKPVGNWVEWHPGVVLDPSQAGYNKVRWNGLNTTVTVAYNVPFVKGLSAKVSLNTFKRDEYNKQFNLPYNMILFNTLGEHNHIVGDQAVGIRPRSAQEYLLSRYDTETRYQFNGQINYKKVFGKHELDGLLVYEQAEEDNVWFNGRRDNFISAAIDQYVAGSTVGATANGSQEQSARISYVGVANYNFDKRYLFEASFRYDGSVIFAPEKRWGFFPAGSFGWRISREPFFQSKFVDDLMIRLSAGLLGNDAVGGFQWLQSYDIVNGAIFGDQAYGLQPGSLVNRDITWEKSLSYNAGLDMRFWQKRMNIKLDLFYRHTYDILGSRQLSIPSTFGAEMPDENYQEIDARGFEVELGYDSKAANPKGDFSYSVSGNFGYAVNEVIQLDEAENLRPYQSRIGRPTGGIMGYVATRILRT